MTLIGANAKGSLGLILAMLGYSLDIITLDMFAIVIFISLFSTAVAAPLMMKRTVRSDATVESIAEEANRGYDLIVMSTDLPSADADYVFGPLVDNVILQSRTRALVIYEPDPTKERKIKRVLVPVSGSELSVTAAEFGISLAKSLNATVACLSIMESDSQDLYGEETQSGHKIEKNISSEIEKTLKELAAALDVDFESVLVQTTSYPAQAAVLTAQQQDIDLIVLGAEPKFGAELFVGHMINFVLRNAPCAVAVLKM